jgi:hypothetical protein
MLPNLSGALLGPLACGALGVAALVAPATFGVRTGLAATGSLGRSELRAVFGGVFIGLAAACLVLAVPAAYWAAAAAFFGGAAAKVLSAAVERGVFPAALPGLVVDLVAASLFVWGARSF